MTGPGLGQQKPVGQAFLAKSIILFIPMSCKIIFILYICYDVKKCFFKKTGLNPLPNLLFICSLEGLIFLKT